MTTDTSPHRWRILLLTCRDPATDFRRPLAEALQAQGHEVTTIFVKRRPQIEQMARPGETRVIGLLDLARYVRVVSAEAGDLLVINSTNLAFPLTSLILRLISKPLWLFDMHDDLLYATTGIRRFKQILAQRLLTGMSDLIVHAAPTLQALFPRSRHLGNASSFRAMQRPATDYSRVLVLASLDTRFDFDFMSRVARDNPALSFDIHGQVSKDNPVIAAQLKSLVAEAPNLTYFGSYDMAGLPAILQRYAVTLAPYVVEDDITFYIDPLRFYHCLNSGMEVISTAIPAVQGFLDVAHVVRSPDEVGPLVARLAHEPAARLNTVDTSAGRTWDRRAEALMDIVDDHRAKRTLRPRTTA